MKFVVCEKSGKAYSAKSDQAMFIGKKINDVVQLDTLGLTGFEAKVTGGSDKEGFPMHQSVPGSARKKIFTSKGVGFRAKKKGEKRRVSVRGNTISADTSQVNLLVVKEGTVKLNEVLRKEGPIGDDALSAKERAIKKSLEMAGKAELGSGLKKAKH